MAPHAHTGPRAGPNDSPSPAPVNTHPGSDEFQSDNIGPLDDPHKHAVEPRDQPPSHD